MAKILANDGISKEGQDMLEKAGHEVVTAKIEQDDLANKLNDFDAIIVRSATKVRKELIDAVPNIKFIGRAGVGMDNIDVDYARGKGLEVANTPAASSASVAELAIGHMLTLYRFLHHSNQQMPQEGTTAFKALKKRYAKGRELAGKTLGVIGAGRIGVETMKRAVGMGMSLKVHDPQVKEVRFELLLAEGLFQSPIEIKIETCSMDELLAASDVISLHVPNIGKYIIDEAELQKMKTGAMLINCARGGVVNEKALLQALEDGKVAFAGVDVFEEEPTNNESLLKHPNTSVTPHIGGSTQEAQDRIGREMAQKVIDFFA